MKIKRNVAFKLRAYGKNNDLFQIRLRTPSEKEERKS